MKRFATVVSSLAGALLLLGLTVKEAAAVDPFTGTWTGTAAAGTGATCAGLVNGVAPVPGGIDTTIKISPVSSPATGFNISVDLNRADLGIHLNQTNLYHGKPFQKTGGKKPPKTSRMALTECGTAVASKDLVGTVGNFLVGPNKTTGVIELKGTLLSEDGASSAVECSFKGLTLTPGDPGVVSCP